MIDPDRRAWRVGHASDPLGFVPWRLQAWKHRFDDPQRVYRTLYCAPEAATALREAIQNSGPAPR